MNALQTNPNVVVVLGSIFSSPAQLFDFDPTPGKMTPIRAPSGSFLPFEPAYVTRMLVLPTGELLLSDSSNQLYVYTPDGSTGAQLRPIVRGVEYNGRGVFTLSGNRLNGQSAGAAYGDDDEMNENFPIVRLEDPQTGNAYYCRTTDWSSVTVDGQTHETVNFTLNSAVKSGNYGLYVIGAGIASSRYPIQITNDEIPSANNAGSAQIFSTSAVPSTAPTRLERLPRPLHHNQ